MKVTVLGEGEQRFLGSFAEVVQKMGTQCLDQMVEHLDLIVEHRAKMLSSQIQIDGEGKRVEIFITMREVAPADPMAEPAAGHA